MGIGIESGIVSAHFDSMGSGIDLARSNAAIHDVSFAAKRLQCRMILHGSTPLDRRSRLL